MRVVKTSELQGILVGQIVLSSIGALLLVVTDFGGYYFSQTGVDVYGYIYLGSGLLASLLILLAVAGFGLALYGAGRSLQAKELPPELLRSYAQMSVQGGVLAAGVAAIGGLVLGVDSTLEGIEWWLDAGFYGAFVGGLLTALFGRLVVGKLGGDATVSD